MYLPGLLLAKLDTVFTRKCSCICLKENVEETVKPPERGGVTKDGRPGKQVYSQLNPWIEDELHDTIRNLNDMLGRGKDLYPRLTKTYTSSLCSIYG